MGVDVGKRKPLSVAIEGAPRDDAMKVRIPFQVIGKRLDDSDHAWLSFLVVDGGLHELFDGFIGGTGELGEEFTAKQEVKSEHFWKGKGPQTMADIIQKLVFEKGGESSAAFGIT